jgi:arylsulfatase
MKQKSFSHSFIIIIILSFFLFSDVSGEKPNIILVMTDDQGYGDFSFSGNPSLKTPNIDRLSREGILLTDFHAAPMCTPTRGQLMTGRDALYTGATMVSSGFSFVYSDIPMMPEILKQEGYSSALFGKWHLGDNYPFRPMDRGFDMAIWHKGGGINSTSDYWFNDYYNDKYWHNDTLKQYQGYCTDVWFDEAMRWMDACHEEGKPFFAYISTNAPHWPYFVEDKYRKPYESLHNNLSSYFGMIANIDENMGRLDSMMEVTGIAENTILVFLTDNGGIIGTSFYNAGMRDKKESLYEGGHRVPCIIRYPGGNLKAPAEINKLTQVQDILPTLLDLCEIETRTFFDGLSITDMLKGKEQPRLNDRMAVVQYGTRPFRSLELPLKHDACVMWGKWRLVKNTELYHIETDPGQVKNIYSEHPDITDRMAEFYQKWWEGAEQLVYNRLNYIHVRSDKESPTILTAHDWMTILTSVQPHVRKGFNRTGPWNIYVEEGAEYRVRLYRWPEEAKLKLCDKAPEYKGFDGVYAEGKALAIARANLKVREQEYSTPVNPADTCAVFYVYLPVGHTQLQTFFYDDEMNQLSGAYYVYIDKNE